MRNGMDPGEENNRPSYQLVEGDVLVKWNDVVQRGPAGHGNEVSAYGEQNECHIDVQN